MDHRQMTRMSRKTGFSPLLYFGQMLFSNPCRHVTHLARGRDCAGFYSEMDHNRAVRTGDQGQSVATDVLRKPILRRFEEVDRWREEGKKEEG